MSSLIKGARYIQSAVMVSEERARPFSLNPYLNPGLTGPSLPDAAAVERERLETARIQAERLVAEAESRASEIVRESMVKGYEEGFAEGLRRAEDQTREQVERLTQIISNALTDHDTMIRSAQKEAAALALAVATKVVNREIKQDPETVLSVVQGALERIPPAERVRVLVNPEDEDLVRERWSEVAGANARGLEWDLATDPMVGRGGCVIEARSGFVDGRIETQLSKLAEAFEAEP